ncbi:MAG: glycosyltransferase family 2 protein [Fusobacterium sp.]|uniref:glycosyltransferase family 2 protein n=1 Tax=Fusobacterium sp. TaxID=68766 RepID=UPI003993E539
MISFIIPIYNTKLELLKRCFSSILELKHLKYEVLLIDDGSEKFIEEFCKDFIKDYSNFYFFRKENEGVSRARNLGIKLAKGNYVFFIDSDDTIVAESLDSLKLEKDTDLVLFDFELIEKEKKKEIKVLDIINKKNFNLKDIVLEFLINSDLNAPWAKIYHRQFLLKNHIIFNKEIVTGEDLNFNLDCLMCNPKIIYEKKVVYNYYREEISSRNRLLKYKERLIGNYNYLEKKKLKILSKLDLDFQEKIFFIKNIVSLKIKNIFNTIIDAEEEKILTLNFKNKIEENIREDLKNIKYTNFFTKLRYFLMYFKLWIIIKIVGKFRKLYLKVRRAKI